MKQNAFVLVFLAVGSLVTPRLAGAEEKGDEYITDKGGGVFEVNATTGLTADNFSDNWTNRFAKSGEKFIVKGADGKGLWLDYPEIGCALFTQQLSHIVFDGGVHGYAWGHFSNPRPTTDYTYFAYGATPGNPSFLVTNGATLFFNSRTFTEAWYGNASSNGVIEVAANSRLVITNDVNLYDGRWPGGNFSHSFWRQQIRLQPGSTLSLAMEKSRRWTVWANSDQNFANFYVPDCAAGETRVARFETDPIFDSTSGEKPYLRVSTGGVGFYVGENATLDFAARFSASATYGAIYKNGRGTMNVTGDKADAWNYAAVHFVVREGALTYCPPAERHPFLVTVSAGATYAHDATKDGFGIYKLNNAGTVNISGTKEVRVIDAINYGSLNIAEGTPVVYERTIVPTEGRAKYFGEPLAKLTLRDSAYIDITKTPGKAYPITSCDGTYVYFDYVETLTNGQTTVSGVHSLKVTNDVAVTMSDTDIGGRTMKLDVDGSLTLTAPLKGIIAQITGAGDITLSGAKALMIGSAAGFTGTLTVNNGLYTIPKALEGHVTVGANAFVNFATVSEMASAKMRFTVTGYTGAALTDFPLLVRVSEATAPGFYDLAAGGFRICAADGTELPYDTDVWDPSGESLVWVKVPTLQAGTTLDFCFGAGTSGLASSETWRRTNLQPSMTGNTENYAGVWHMSTEDGADVPDASGNGLTATPRKPDGAANTSLRRADGKLGAARQIHSYGNNDGLKKNRYLRVDYANYAPMMIATNFTVSTWVRPRKFGVDIETLERWPRPFANYSSRSAGYTGWEIQNTQNANHQIRLYDGMNHDDPAQSTFTGMTLSYDTWTYLTFVFNNKTYRAYTNGVLVAEVTLTRSDAGAPLGNHEAPFSMGGRYDEWSLGGDMDEARLYDGVQSADWVAADYATQTKTDFVTAGAVTESPVLDTKLEQFGDVVVARVALSDVPNATSTVNIYFLTTTGETNKTRTVILGAGESKVFEFTDLSADIARVVVTGTGVTAGSATAMLPLETHDVYRLLSGDVGNSSLHWTSDSYKHANNWSNLVTAGAIITSPVAGADYVLYADRKDPSGNIWNLRTTGYKSDQDYTFPGNSLTIIGDRQRNTTFVNGGFLASKHYYSSDSSRGLVTVNKLILKNGSFSASTGDYVHYLKLNVEIPEGYAGYFDIASDEAGAGRWVYLWGSFAGAGTAVFCRYGTSDTWRGYYLHSDWSSFIGKIEINRHQYFYLCPDLVEPADLEELTPDGIALDNICHTQKNWSRANTKDAPSRLIFDGDMTWAATNRGITVRAGGTGTTTNVWHFAVKDDATVSLANPLYGEGNLGLNNEMVGYTNGTLRLSASRGEFSGTFYAKGGNLVLAGTKPLGEGTLDLSGAATATIDATELDQPCYLKGFTKTGDKKIAVETPSAYDEDFAFLVTPAEGGVTRANLNLATLPEGIGLRTRVADGLRTFTIGKKLGTILIIR